MTPDLARPLLDMIAAIRIGFGGHDGFRICIDGHAFGLDRGKRASMPISENESASVLSGNMTSNRTDRPSFRLHFTSVS